MNMKGYSWMIIIPIAIILSHIPDECIHVKIRYNSLLPIMPIIPLYISWPTNGEYSDIS